MQIGTRVTNRIRWILDERIPRSLREARWFMAPLFFVWCKGRHVRTWMDFKRIAPAMTRTELRDFYRQATSFASERDSDTNPAALAHVRSVIDPAASSLLDVGCGRGHFLRTLQKDEAQASMRLTGCDLTDRAAVGRASYVVGDTESLPFSDEAFEVVTCFHTLEHLLRPDAAIAELRRICRRQLILVVPRQKYFFYTMDLHLNFFPEAAAFAALLGVSEDAIQQFGDDLVYLENRPLRR
jgi:SAM-dependent methyltransferase